MAAAVAVVWCGQLRAQTTIPGDFSEITGTTTGQSVSGWGSPGSIACHGKSSFPILKHTNGVAVMAAGRYNDGASATTARAVAFSHNGPLHGGSDSMPALLEASVKWASRKTTPSTITVGCGSGINASFWTSRGYLTKSVTTTMSSSSNDLSGVDVFIFDWHSDYSASAITKIQTFTAAGGGIVCGSTPWALGTQPTADAYAVMGPFGLTNSGGGWGGTSPATVPATAPSPYYGALNGTDDLILDKEGGITMSSADKGIAANAIDQVLAVRPDVAALNADLDTLGDGSHYGLIPVTAAAPLVRASKPVEAMLARYQSRKFDAMTAAQLVAHPSASDWPGSPAAGSTVSKTIPVNGTVPADVYMNQGNRGRRIETRLYAAPGATLTVTIPADKVSAGLRIDIGCHIDENFHLGQWNRFPKVTRRVPLTQTVTQTGNVFGGLVWIEIPAGSNLGNFNVSISGALEAPCFQLGVDTDATWNATLKNLPGAWGCIMTNNVPGYGNTPGFTVYLSRTQLQKVTSAETVALHWKNVIETSDHFMGYTAFRKRGESALSDRDISAGGGHAGYPVMMAYWDSDMLTKGILTQGDWGFYHELGHTFQDSFDGNYTIATHGEMDVNLPPGLLYNIVHQQTTWDSNAHPGIAAGSRLNNRAQYLALPAAQQTWQTACEGDPVNDSGETAFDFYCNIVEAFGWQAYHTALSRLMGWLQGGTDAELSALSSSDPNYRRNRFYLIFCDATGRNLDTYFQRYGLGVAGKGYEITASVKSTIAAKGYPVWNDNSAMTAISNPGTVSLPEDTPPGSLVHDFSVTDPDPGETHTYEITAGDPNGDFSIGRLTGELRISAIDYERTTSYSLTVRASGNSIPFSGTRHTIVRTFTVNVANLVEVPAVTPRNFLARGSMTSGTVLGSVTAMPETGRTITGYAIVNGNGAGIFAIGSTGAITLQLPASLPNPGTVVLTVGATDSAGQTGYGKMQVFCNTSAVLADQHWKLDETGGTAAANTAGGLTGAYQGSPTLGQPGARMSTDKGMRLDGVDDKVNVPPLGVTGNTFTISGWVKRNGNQADWAGLVLSRTSGSNAGSGMMLGPDNDLRYFWNESHWGYSSGLILPDNRWAFVAVVVEPSKATLYLHDGATLSSATHDAAQSSATLNGDWHLGYDTVGVARYFKGDMDDVRMYYRSLSPAEIQQAYHESAVTLVGSVAPPAYADGDGDDFSDSLELALGTDPANVSSVPPSAYAGLRGWWQLDEGSGTTAADSSGYSGQTGTLINSPAWAVGVAGSSLELNGTSQAVSIPALNTPSNTFAICAWVRRNGTQNTYAGIVYAWQHGPASGMMFGPSNQLRYTWDGGHWGYSSGLTVPDNVWTFCGVVIEPGKATLYMMPAGGTMQTAVNVNTHGMAPLAGDFYLGQDTGTSSRYMKGRIDEARIFGRSLNGAEMQFIADATLPPSGMSQPPGQSDQAWLAANGQPEDGSGNGDGAPDKSPDGDGVSNALKFALGLPADSAGYAGRVRGELHEANGERYNVLTYTRPEPAPGGSFYSVEVSADLATWNTEETEEISSTLENGLRTVTVRDRIPVGGGAPARFIRLRVSP